MFCGSTVRGWWFVGDSMVIRKRYVVINGKQILTKGMFLERHKNGLYTLGLFAVD